MKRKVQRILVTKKDDPSFSVCYDIEGIDVRDELTVIFAEPAVDEYQLVDDEYVYPPHSVRTALHDGQFDQRADAVLQLLKLKDPDSDPLVRVSTIFYFSDDEALRLFLSERINPVDMTVLPCEIPATLRKREQEGKPLLSGELAMTDEDLALVQAYFEREERREYTETEIKVLDTYWSDHCRHTTFHTELTDISIEAGAAVSAAFEKFMAHREKLGRSDLPLTLMEMATLHARAMRSEGKLSDLDISEEINACSVVRKVETERGEEEYLIMFKNETHNHPTEIEPYGGAATCVGGAIRDPLSGRSYVYQSVRVTGAAYPIDTPPKGKLMQTHICREAARGFSSYGNQIGVATGLVDEIYHEGYLAKRLEVGAVIGAVKKEQVRRERPKPGDVVLLLGGATGRDGIGGATGSSKEQKESSSGMASAEVQKGNAPEERKLQRLFRNPKFSSLVKKCNDFGAGGVCVAIGELADSIEIRLDRVPLKYKGLTPTEIAISESQERMAIVVDAESVEEVKKLAESENVSATAVASITDTGRLVMKYHGETVFDVSRAFIETNGAKLTQKVRVLKTYDAPISANPRIPGAVENSGRRFFQGEERKPFPAGSEGESEEFDLYRRMGDFCNASRMALIDRFDSTIGSRTVLMPFGGRTQSSPTQVACANIPGSVRDVSVLTYGFYPGGHPFEMAQRSILESVAKVLAAGGDLDGIRLSLQEYFPKLRSEEGRWGSVFSALLGAYVAQEGLGIAAIGGKDSMSGSFENLDVPSTLLSFAMNTQKTSRILSTDLKRTDSRLYLLKVDSPSTDFVTDYASIRRSYRFFSALTERGIVLSAMAVGAGGVAPTLAMMGFGNKVGFRIGRNGGAEYSGADPKDENGGREALEFYAPMQGSIVFEVPNDMKPEELLRTFAQEPGGEKEEAGHIFPIGETLSSPYYEVDGVRYELRDVFDSWVRPLKELYGDVHDIVDFEQERHVWHAGHTRNAGKEEESAVSMLSSSSPDDVHTEEREREESLSRMPLTTLLLFPGTNSEDDMAKEFAGQGSEVREVLFRNTTGDSIRESIREMAQAIGETDILVIPGGFSAADEPDGSGKFIASILRQPSIREAIHQLLERKGLILGICNGFQALVKTGLLPFGKISDNMDHLPTLTYNRQKHHISRIAPVVIRNTDSPWLRGHCPGEVLMTAFSHGEGRFVAEESLLRRLEENGQIATVYGIPNFNGSVAQVEGLVSPCGQILGKMGHVERVGEGLYKNIHGSFAHKIIASGVAYARHLKITKP